MTERSALSQQIAALAPERDDLAASLLRASLRSRLVDADPTVRLGRYEVGRRLGGGGMGVVYEGLDPELDRRVAIKVLHERSDDADAVLQREAQLLAQFSHEHSVTVFDIGADASTGRVWVAMELVDGVNMRHWLSQAKPAQSEIVAAFAAAGAALGAMHRAGLCHGDFKPENVLVGPSVVKVADFGLARLVGERSTGSSDAMPSPDDRARTVGGGTAGYVAPERLDGGKASPLADQFAFCVAMFEGLHGELPYASDGLARSGRPTVPATRTRFDRALQRGLDPDATRRFASMETLAAALHRAGARHVSAPWIAAVAIAVTGGTWLLVTSPSETTAVGVADLPPAVVAAPAKIDLAPIDALAQPITDHINAAAYDKATALLPELFATAETLGSDEGRAIALRIRGTIAQRTSAYESAIIDFERARDLAWGADLESLAIASAISLSHLYAEQLADFERANRELDMAAAVLLRRGANPDDNLAFVRARGVTRLRAGDRQGAMQQFDRVVMLLGDGDANPAERGSALFYLAEAAWAIEPERARQAAEEALPLMLAVYGPDHPFVAAVQGVLGKLADAGHRWADARAAYGEALRIYEAAGTESSMIAQMHFHLTAATRQSGDLDNARAHLSRGRAVVDGIGGDETILHAALEDESGNIEYAAGNRSEAARHYRAAARILEGLMGPDAHDMIPVLVHLSRVAIDDRKYDDALEHAEHALRIIGAQPHGSKQDALDAAAQARRGAGLAAAP